MKNLTYLFLLSLTFFGCSSDDGDTTDVETMYFPSNTDNV